MNKEIFNYELPNELIAQKPLENREQSRLLVANALDRILKDKSFFDLAEVLNQTFDLNQNHKKVLLIANDSRVYQARVRVRRKTGGKAEVFLLETGEKETYKCLLKPKGKLSVGETLYAFDNPDVPLFQVSCLQPSLVQRVTDLSFQNIVEKYGEMPLPPYIKREQQDNQDKDRYQTVYSNFNQTGSAAAPTAGLHFTDNIIENCKKNGVEFAFVTLNVGLGTFLPVSADHVKDHEMHEEHYLINEDLIQKINLFLKNKWPIVFVGTTSLRAVESFFRIFFKENDHSKILEMAEKDSLLALLREQSEKWLSTKLFLYPRHENHKEVPFIGNGIVTNFHQPESTLAMLIASLVGIDFWKKMYSHAIEQKYRFFSYGDSSFILFKRD
jgi:S-adenosylmethionine:tRNA ribosyltransferase-isomerase